MTSKEMFGPAKWVAADSSCEAPLLRVQFEVDTAEDAAITICGLGFFKLFINGHRVGEECFVPANSDYEQRDLSGFTYPITDRMSHRIYCLRYNVGAYITKGQNAVGVMLGNGWYNQPLRKAEGPMSYGQNKLCFRLDIAQSDGQTVTVVSDERVRWAHSHIVKNNLFYGETHDYSLEKPDFSRADFDATGWTGADIVPAPESDIVLQDCPADKVIRFTPVTRRATFEKTSVYDAGEAMSGYATIVCEKEGEVITVRYADELNEDLTLNYASSGGDWQIQKDVFLSADGRREYTPCFTWHAFRYFELTNNATPSGCAVVHADVAVTSAFECAHPTLNWLYGAFIRTQLANMHGGVPSDCPHRERLGYTGDGQLCADAAMLLLDSRALYKKWMEDIADGQDPDTGHVQHTAPFAGGGGGPGGWGGAIVQVPYMYYKHYGDTVTLNHYFPRMLRYLDYLESHSENSLVCREEDGGWCLGDWCTPAPMQLPEAFVNTYFYIRFMQTVLRIAAVLGREAEAAHLAQRVHRVKRAFLTAYYSPHSHSFLGGIQGADAFALDIGLGDEKTFANMVAKYKQAGMYDTGIFGTEILTRVLFERGEADLAFSLLTSEKVVSFYSIMAAGATTLWENWNGASSHNHPMFGAVTAFLPRYLLGITQAEHSAGYETPVIAPQLVEGLNEARGYVQTVRGRIGVAYQSRGASADFKVELPPGMEAAFILNGTRTRLSAGTHQFLVNMEVPVCGE